MSLCLEIGSGRIVLTGDLDGSYDVPRVLADSLKKAGKSAKDWTVDASGIRLTVDGEAEWVKAVHRFLGKCNLTYLPSQLASVLEFDEEYNHASTKLPGHEPATSLGTAAYA